MSDTANGLLITAHSDPVAIHWRLKELAQRAAPFILTAGVHVVGRVEDEIHEKTFAKPLMEMRRPGFEQDYVKLLDEAMGIWARGSEFYAYASYLWEIVYAYFDNMKEGRSYAPLHLLENQIAQMKERHGANWLAARMVHLRRSYLAYVGKPRNVSEAIRRYNEARAHDDKKIVSSSDLFRHVQDALDTDLRRWIEGEGAYNLIVGEKVFASKKQEYEKLVQKTLKAQVEVTLLRRGFQVDVMREPELLDGKKVDFWVRYGFVGPVIVEVKLSSNTDLQGTEITRSPSYESMERYMHGYAAAHGILVVIENDEAKNLPLVRETFQKIRNVWVQSFDCHRSSLVSKSTTIGRRKASENKRSKGGGSGNPES